MVGNGSAGSRPAGRRPDLPEPPGYVREAARAAPGEWVGLVDPAWQGEEAPPLWAVVGQWRSEADGEIVEWLQNDEYRPSPKAYAWPEPTDLIEQAVRLAATGYGTGDDIPDLLAEATVAVLVRADGSLVTVATPAGKAVVPVFTAVQHLEKTGRMAYEVLPMRDLIDRIPEGHLIYLNASAPVAMQVELGPLREAIARRRPRPDGPEAVDLFRA